MKCSLLETDKYHCLLWNTRSIFINVYARKASEGPLGKLLSGRGTEAQGWHSYSA